MSDRSRYYWLPNFLTGSRLVLTVPILIAALDERWVLAFWLFIIALLTDFADGYAAIRFNARSRLGELLDPIADFALAATGIAVLIWAGDLPLWAGGLMLVPALAIGYINLCTPKQSEVHRKHHLFSVPYLFVVWTIGAWYFAAQAYGWSWWYVAATVLLLGIAAFPKRHRLQAWFLWTRTPK